MPEDPEVPTPPKKRNERTEAKFLEDADNLIAEAEREGTEYNPPNPIAKLVNIKAKRDAVLLKRTENQADAAAEETKRNNRENLYKPLNSDVSSLIAYTKSAGVPANDLEALQTIARTIKGKRAAPIEPNDGASHISVAHLSYVTRADNYSRLIEQYDSLGIPTNEDKYKAETYRARLAALRQANADVIQSEAVANTSDEQLDKLAYTDADSLLNACISGKNYIKSKYGTTGQPYKNIAKTRFVLPSRLRRK